MCKNTKKETLMSMDATDAPVVLSNIKESQCDWISGRNNIGIRASNNRIAGKSYGLVGMNRHRWKLWSMFPIEYLMMQICLTSTLWRMSQSIRTRFRCNSTVGNETNSMGKFDNQLEMADYM
jgi:hypothetical protein